MYDYDISYQCYHKLYHDFFDVVINSMLNNTRCRDMNNRYYIAFKEAIIPLLEDQHVIDQLWCASKSLQPSILNNLTSMTCYSRPMDSVIKPKGLYSSYISKMRSLTSLTVYFEPSLRYSHDNHVSHQAQGTEVFSRHIPMTLTSFEVLIYDIGWDNRNDHLMHLVHIFQWLDRFPNILLGRG